ncbi:cation transporter, partial [Enterococcus faecium]
MARETGSGALLAAAWDARLDALGGIAVIAGILIARWGGPRWAWADHAAALVIAATVFWIGLGLLRDKVRDLMDHQAPSELLA